MDEHSGNPEPELNAAIVDARSLAREQVLAAWQIHLDRVRDQLDSGWREVVDEIFDERFSEVEARLADRFQQAVSTRAAAIAHENATQERASARRDLTDWFNQTGRRLKEAETRDVWIHSVLDAATTFCRKAAFFLVTAKGLKLEGVSGADVPEAGSTEIPMVSAPAFESAVESQDTVVAAGTPGELSQTVSSLLGDASQGRVYLFPILVRQKVAAILYAEPDGDSIDVSAVELVVALASSSIETTETVTLTPHADGLVHIDGAELSEPRPRPSWAELSKSEQELHLRAQRFARTQVAQLLLHKVNQVRHGRASKNLYETLRGDIDAGREAFRQQYLENSPSMVDYYHQELVRTLAKDSVDALGPDYPGPVAH